MLKGALALDVHTCAQVAMAHGLSVSREQQTLLSHSIADSHFVQNMQKPEP